MIVDAVELFAGPGGVSEATAALGIPAVGIEYEANACATARAAGHIRIQADIAALDPRSFHRPVLLHGSPPCQGFSQAGKGVGRKDTPLILEAIEKIRSGLAADEALAWLRSVAEDDKSALCLEPLRWALDLLPAVVTLEQVPLVLPLWEACATVLRANGYAVWTGKLHAEQYDVPQTRIRAILVARRFDSWDESRLGPLTDTALAPVPVRRRFKKGVEQLDGDPSLAPWLSMADALSWGMTARPYVTVSQGTAGGGPDPQALGDSHARKVVVDALADGHWLQRSNYSAGGKPGETAAERGRVMRDMDEPSSTVTSKGFHFVSNAQANATVRSADALADGRWQFRGAGATSDVTSGQRPRDLDEPAHAVLGKGSAAWTLRNGPQPKATVRSADEPASTITAGHDSADRVWTPQFHDQSGTPVDKDWPSKRPSTAVAGRDLVQNPGATANATNGSTKSRNDGVRVSVVEAAILQGFRADYPWQGTKTAQHQQIGNAVPPPLAFHFLLAGLRGMIP